MKRTLPNLLFFILLLITALLLLKLWSVIERLPQANAQPPVFVEVTAVPRRITVEDLFGNTHKGAHAAVYPAPEPDIPMDTTAQAANTFAAGPEAAYVCMRAAVANRRSSPACREILQHMGSGR